MAIAVADSWIVTGATSVTVSGFAAGDLCVVVAAKFRDGSNAMGTPSDNAGNAYNQRKQNVDTGTFRSTCMVGDAVVASGPTSVSVAFADNIVVLRCTGATASPYDDSNLDQSSADDPPFPSLTTTDSGIVVLGLTHDGGTVLFDAPSGYTMAQEEENTSINPIAVAYKITAAGSQSGNWITNFASDYSMVSSAYIATAPPVPTGIAWIVA